MGSDISSSGIMNDCDSDSDTMEENRNTADITVFLRYLINRDDARAATTSSDSSCCDIFSSTKGIYVDKNPDTSQVQGSDLAKNIKMRCMRTSNANGHRPSVCSLLNERQVGMGVQRKFSNADKCQIYERYLPNKMGTVDRYSTKVFCGSFAQEGNIFMSASQDFFVRLYDSQSGRFRIIKLVEARDVGWSILDTAVSPDGHHVIYCSWSEYIHIFNVFGEVETHHSLHLFPEEERFCVFAVRFSQDGKEILGGANDECLYIYNRECNERTLRIQAHTDDVNTVAFADKTSQILFSGGDDGICKVWDRRTLCEAEPKAVGNLVGHEGGITYVDSKGDGRYLITNSKDQTIRLWDMRKFSPSSSVEDSLRTVNTNAWDYRWQAVPRSLGKTRKKIFGDTSLMTYRGHSVRQTLIRCHFSPEATTGQRYIYTGCSQGRIIIYDILTGKIKSVLSGHKSCVRDVSWHPYRNEILSSSWDGSIGHWTYSSKLELDSSDDSDDCDDEEDEYDGIFRLKPRRSQRLANHRRKNMPRSRS